jgi:hypothetical protein
MATQAGNLNPRSVFGFTLKREFRGPLSGKWSTLGFQKFKLMYRLT